MATLKIIDGPRFSNPINDRAGLYIQVLAHGGRPSSAELLEFVRAQVVAEGFDPDGQGWLGMPCTHGINSRTYAMWFYDRRK